eukprot:GABV01009449.1.p1 GENE.GABV01009449.1~~GABV01009449.1.p1  ORF type:complete len:164 (-),score=22.38 GABV01009449.1:66-557(-)
MLSTLSGRDVFILMPTGAGKSLIYQLPCLVTQLPTIVISPLISLMNDQVLALQSRGVSACALTSAQTDPTVWRNALEGRYKLIYLAPERLASFAPQLRTIHDNTGGFTSFAIDEAHCVSEWGPRLSYSLSKTTQCFENSFLQRRSWHSRPPPPLASGTTLLPL